MSKHTRPTINTQLVKHLSKLAKIDLEATEVDNLQHDLENMLSMVDKLNDVDVKGVSPLPTPSTRQDSLRDDIPVEPLSKSEALSNAPITDGQYFKVQKVVSK